MQLTLLLCASLIAAAPLPEPGWGKAALITGGIGATAFGGYEIARHVSKKKEEKKMKEMEEKLMLEALAASLNPSSTSTSEASTDASSAAIPSSEALTAAKASADSKEVHPFVSLKETPPFPDKNPMAGNQ